MWLDNLERDLQVRRAHAPAQSWIRGHGDQHACAGHRRDDGHLQHRQHRAPEAAAICRARSARAGRRDSTSMGNAGPVAAAATCRHSASRASSFERFSGYELTTQTARDRRRLGAGDGRHRGSRVLSAARRRPARGPHVRGRGSVVGRGPERRAVGTTVPARSRRGWPHRRPERQQMGPGSAPIGDRTARVHRHRRHAGRLPVSLRRFSHLCRGAARVPHRPVDARCPLDWRAIRKRDRPPESRSDDWRGAR